MASGTIHGNKIPITKTTSSNAASFSGYKCNGIGVAFVVTNTLTAYTWTDLGTLDTLPEFSISNIAIATSGDVFGILQITPSGQLNAYCTQAKAIQGELTFVCK